MSIEPQPDTQTDHAVPSRAPLVTSDDRMSPMDVWRVLTKQRFLILAVTVISLAAAGIYSFRTKPVYESVSRIEIKPKSGANVGLQSLLAEQHNEEGSAALQTEILVLQSDTVMLETAQSLNILGKLHAASRTGGNAPAAQPSGELTSIDRLSLIRYIKGGMHVRILPNTDMIEIRYQNNDPKLATEVVNKLVDTYIDDDLRSKFNRTLHVSSWLQKQLEDLKQDASDSQIRLAGFQKQHNIVGTDETSNLTMQSLGQISANLETVEADRIMKEARMRSFESKDTDLVALMGDNPNLATLRSQLNELQYQRAQSSVKYGEHNPKMQDLNLQINKLQARINTEVDLARSQVRKEYEGALGAEDMLRKRLDAQKEEAYRLNEDVGQYAILRHDAELNRDLYDTLQMRLKEASVTAGLSATDITVVDRAEVPFMPIAPRKSAALMLGLIGGLLGGIVVAFIVESIDDRLQTSEGVEIVSLLPSLATIPHIGGEADKRKQKQDKNAETSNYHIQQLIALNNPKSVAAEAYRGLRSSLLLSSIDNPPRVIVVTSAFPGEGKTTTAINTAIVLAQRGERVLLVDADLRRGSLDRVFGIADGSFGLSTVLSQPINHQELPVPLPDLPTLHVLPTGPRPPNPAEMLSSHRMVEQLRQWMKEFDRIVLDTAPVLAVSDTQAMSVLADAIILVVRAGMTRKRALLRARNLLWRINAPLTGVVVNDVDMRLENFYTYRYGLYGYTYGYGYKTAPKGEDISYYAQDEEEKEKGE